MQVKQKTLAEHRNYLHEIVKLKLFFLHLWLEQHPEERFSDVIRNRVDIFRKTDANQGPLNPQEFSYEDPAWKNMEDAAFEIYKQTKNDRALFEKEAFEVFRKSIDDRCERDYADSTVLARYQCGSLKHELALTPEGRMVFHIANAVAPHSIFEDPAYLKECFLSLLDITEKIYNGTMIQTNTWLNECPKWLAYFPEEWKQNMGPARTDVKWYYSYWGQFITARGTFNEKYGQILRTTGKFPYLPRLSWCTTSAMRKHLKEFASR